MRKKRPIPLVAVVAGMLLWGAIGAAAEDEAPPPAEPAENLILETSGLWRFRTVWENEELALPDGGIEHATINTGPVATYFQKNKDAIEAPPDVYKVQKVETVRLPSQTSADWFKPDFDDSSWARIRGPMLDRSIKDEWKLILMRGRFEVADPARAGELTLSITFRGGVVVYLNGHELTRAFMPAGPIDLYTSATGYTAEENFTKEGFLFLRQDRGDDVSPRIERRTRHLTGFKIPADRLIKGVNVLSVAVHRAPTLANVYLRHRKGTYASHDDVAWARIGLSKIKLVAPPAAAVVPSVGLVRNRGFKVWSQSTIQKVFVADYPDPFAPLSPIRIVGVRNGTFAGQVIVGDDTPIRGLKVEVMPLSGPGEIPSSAWQVRYGVPDGRAGRTFFDSLEESPPTEVPVYEEHGGALQPIWITVTVPSNAKPGDYAGSVRISAEGVKPVSVPIKLRVVDWRLPDVAEYTATMDVIESPESLAMAYDVPLWSDKHMALLDKAFSLLGQLGDKTLYVTCIRRTHFGNEHAMVRWVRGEDGELKPDFTIVEKYLDVAVKHLGRIPGVILYCWEPPESQGHAGGAGGAGRTYDKPILITTLDPKTGKLTARLGPAWGSPEAKVFWKKLTDGIRPVLAKRGLEDSMLFGLIGDTRPTKQAMSDVATGVPNDRWAVHSHYYCHEWQGHTIGYAIALWGIGVMPADPSAGYSFGWSNPFWLAYFPREMNVGSTLVEHRVKLEAWMGGRANYTPFICTGVGPRGLGRLGADFWDVIKDRHGQPRNSLAGRYPEAAWGQLNLNNGLPYILGKGKTGPVATVRSEAFREALQEVEARIFVEKALLDDEARSLLGDELIGRCRTALDERIRMGLHASGEGQSWFISSGWQDRTELLLSLASEVAAKFGRAPRPNLAPRPMKAK
ncbi:MAG: hypothetical protein BIFFINMI_00912 [Phycisphaerae bacterium]|nr:hypothetical protein [Phycisphaerae bacterium]